MGKPLRVLLVEDSADDAELVIHELRQRNDETVAERVETAKEMELALEKQPWNIVLSDYLMPQFNGINALKLLRGKGIDIPFILISGAIGEETAVEAMRLGANDYIMKGNLNRLVPAIERELHEAEARRERRQADRALLESERRLREAQSLGRIGNWEFDVLTQKIEWSDETYRLYGRDKKAGPPTVEEESKYYAPEEAERLREFTRRATENGEEFKYDLSAKLPGGKTAFFNATMRPTKDDSGRVIKLFGTVQDITERKQAEEKIKLGEKRYRDLVESMSNGVSVYETIDGGETFIFEEFNRAAERIERINREDVIGKNITDVFPGVKDFGLLTVFQRVLRTGVPEHHPVSLYRDNRVSGWRENFVYKLSPGEVVAIYDDVTERKQAEDLLRASEEKFRNLVENAPVGIGITTLDGRALLRNQANALMLGYGSAEELLASPVTNRYYNPEERTRFVELARKGVVRDFEVQMKRKDGTPHWVSLTSVPQTTEDGQKLILTIMQDINERKNIQDELRLKASLLDAATDAIIVRSFDDGPKAKFLYANEAACAIFGYTRAELLNITMRDLSTQSSPATTEARRKNLEATGENHMELLLRCKDGVMMPVENHSKLVTIAGKRYALSIIRDITERKRAQADNELKATLLDAAGDMIYVQDLDGRILYANDSTCQTHGYTNAEMIRMKIHDLISPERAKNVEPRNNETFEKGEVRFETEHICKDGMIMPVEVYNRLIKLGDTLAIISVGRDITERKKIDAQMVVTSRLASIGELASGVAHEVNNPLTSVIGFSELLLERPLPEDVKEDLVLINNEAKRAAKVVRNLLTFARKQVTAMLPVNINRIIEKVLELRTYDQNLNNIVTNTRLMPDLPEVMADAFQLQQVFFNLIINAEYFMLEAHKKGVLTITTESIGKMVRVSFADDGPGIADEDLAHLFNPFFTTKPVGKGTGLGLSICHGIIIGFNGRIYAESAPGKGATFIIELPVIEVTD